MGDRITPEKASVLLEKPASLIRKIMVEEMFLPKERRTLDIGQAHRSNGRNYRKPTYRYDIYIPKVLRYMGLESVDELSEEKRRALG